MAQLFLGQERNHQALLSAPRVISVNLHALQVASVFCPADILEVSRSASKCSRKFCRSELLNGFRRGVTSALPSPPHSHLLEGFSAVDVRLLISCGVTDQEASSLFCPHVGDGRVTFCPILTDTVCDLQRQAEQILVMRSPWAAGLRWTFKANLLGTHTHVRACMSVYRCEKS